MTKWKDTEIGKIPEDWEIEPAEKFCVKVTDGTHDSPKEQKSRVHLITSRHIKDGYLDFSNAYSISDADAFEINKRSKVDQWDIIFSMIGTVGQTYLEKDKEVNYVIKNVGLFKTGSELKGKWLFYYLKSKQAKNYIFRSVSGTTQEYMTLDSLRKFPIAFPKSEAEEGVISKILSDFDSKIKLNNQMNATLEAMVQSIFKHWFIDFEFPNEKGEPYKSSGGKMVDSELGKIPEGWTVKKLGDFVDLTKGVSYRSDELNASENALITLKSIDRGGGFNGNGFKEYTGDYDAKQKVVGGDIVVAQTDLTQNAEVIGKPAIVRSISKYKNLVASVDLVIVRPKNNALNRPLIYYLLESRTFQNHVIGYTNGTTVLHLNKKAIPEFLFPKADNELIKNFENIVNDILHKKVLNGNNTDTLVGLRDSLLPKLMSGRIRVPIGAAK